MLAGKPGWDTSRRVAPSAPACQDFLRSVMAWCHPDLALLVSGPGDVTENISLPSEEVQKSMDLGRSSSKAWLGHSLTGCVILDKYVDL